MGIDLKAHGWDEAAENNPMTDNEHAQLSPAGQSDDGQKKTPADVTDENVFDYQENNSVLNNTTSAAEIQRVDIEKFALINKISPWTLVNFGILSKADDVVKFTNNERKIGPKPTIFICPFCGEPTLTYIESEFVMWRCDCLGNDFKRNEDILAAKWGLAPVKDKAEIYRRVKEKYPTFDEDYESHAPHVDNNVGIFVNETDNAPADNPSPVDKIAQQIIDDLELSKGGFAKLSAVDKRGLRNETAERLNFGADENWVHPKMPNSTATPRIIARLGDATDPPAYNAVMTNTGRKKFKWAMDKKNKWAEKSLTAGSKLVFNPPALEAEFCFLSEGEIDAASILQASEFKIAACALGGTSGGKVDLLKRLSRMENPPMLIALFDKDANDAGQNAAADFVIDCHDRFIPVVAKFLDDFITDDEKKICGGKVDANEILQRFGDEKLKAILDRIIADAKPKLEPLAEKFKADRAANTATAAADDALPNVPVGSTRKKNSRGKKSSPEIKDLLDRLNNSATKEQLLSFLDRDRKGTGFTCPKCNSGRGEHGTGAVGFSATGGPHVGCAKCGWGANLFQLFAMKNNLNTTDKDFFTTLRKAADEFHIDYDPKIFEFTPSKPARKNVFSNADTSQLADDATPANETDEQNPAVAEWEAINGKIDPQLLPEIIDAAKYLDSLTGDKITSALAKSSKTLRAVALCRFYDFNLSAAEKFFARVRTAKDDASAQIRAWKSNDGLTAEPSDEIKSLATLKIAELERDVAKIKTYLSKAQSRFAAKWKAQQETKRREKAIEDLNKNLPSTQKILPLCPIDLKLTNEIYFSADSCGTAFVDGNGFRHERKAALTPVVVTKVFRENGSDELEYEVGILSRGKWRRKIVGATVLTSPREVGNLASIGLFPEDTKELAKYFCRLINANEETIPEITTYTKTGWHGDKFIFPGTPDADYRVRRSGIDYDSIFAVQGDAKAWKEKFAEITFQGPQICTKRIVVGACLAAPLLKFIKIPNFHLHLEGTSNYAKTPLPKLGLSIFGNPTEGGMLRGWNSTAKNRLTMAAGFCDLPQGLDELESLSAKDEENLAKDIYSYALGIVNQANQRDGNVRPVETFRGVRVSTGERGMLKDSDKRGAFKRSLSLQVEQPLFTDDAARDLHCFVSENFGHFGRQWVEYIAANHDEIKADFDKICGHFTEKGFKREMEFVSVDSIDKTNFRDVVACSVAYHHFCIALELDTKFDSNRAILDAQEILATLPTVDELSDIKRGIERLASWVVENPTRFITPKLSSENDTAPKAPPPIDDDDFNEDNPARSFVGTVGKIFPNGDVGFFQNAFRRVIEKDLELPSYKKFLRDAYTENILDCPTRKEKTKKVTVDGNRIKIYVFKSSALFPSEQSDDDVAVNYYGM